MLISFGVKMNWETFWDQQQNNPYCELFFVYQGNYYLLLHEDYTWLIVPAEFNEEFDTLGVGEIAENKKNAIISVPEKNYGHRNYDNDENWVGSMDACYKLLTMPFIDGKSFKDIIDDIDFED